MELKLRNPIQEKAQETAKALGQAERDYEDAFREFFELVVGFDQADDRFWLAVEVLARGLIERESSAGAICLLRENVGSDVASFLKFVKTYLEVVEVIREGMKGVKGFGESFFDLSPLMGKKLYLGALALTLPGPEEVAKAIQEKDLGVYNMVGQGHDTMREGLKIEASRLFQRYADLGGSESSD